MQAATNTQCAWGSAPRRILQRAAEVRRSSLSCCSSGAHYLWRPRWASSTQYSSRWPCAWVMRRTPVSCRIAGPPTLDLLPATGYLHSLTVQWPICMQGWAWTPSPCHRRCGARYWGSQSSPRPASRSVPPLRQQRLRAAVPRQRLPQRHPQHLQKHLATCLLVGLLAVYSACARASLVQAYKTPTSWRRAHRGGEVVQWYSEGESSEDSEDEAQDSSDSSVGEGKAATC